MAPVFSKEAILQGAIDHLCLVCESYLRTEREVCRHVATPEHRQNLDSTGYVEKYRHDRVRKVKNFYFCEFCNVLVTTSIAVRLHVEELRHKENKSTQTIRVDDVVVSGNIAIHEEAWHGFIDENTCTICNVEYEDKDVHKSEPIHVINLIQSTMSEANNIYRKTDDSTFHCLICNEVVADITAHQEGSSHKKLLQDCIETTPSKWVENAIQDPNKNRLDDEKVKKVCTEDPAVHNVMVKENIGEKLDSNVLDTSTVSASNCSKSDVNSSKIRIQLNDLQHQNMQPKEATEKSYLQDNDILESVPKFQKNNINVNYIARTAVCTMCSVNLEFDANTIENHMKEHKNNALEMDIETSRALGMDEYSATRDKEMEQDERTHNLQEKAEEHGLTYNYSSNRVHCQICNKHVPSSVTNMNEHVNGKFHKNNVTSSSNKVENLKQKKNTEKTNVRMCNHPRLASVKFINILVRHKSFNNQDVILNEKYCISYHCFTFLTKINNGHVRCQVCEINVLVRDIREHVTSSRHVRALVEVPVILWTESEFIREIRSGIFQCGFCNIIECWEGMEKHLKSTDHERNKSLSNRRVVQYLLTIEEDRAKYEMTSCLLVMAQLHEEFEK